VELSRTLTFHADFRRDVEVRPELVYFCDIHALTAVGSLVTRPNAMTFKRFSVQSNASHPVNVCRFNPATILDSSTVIGERRLHPLAECRRSWQ
jgi:hypothetical protein